MSKDTVISQYPIEPMSDEEAERKLKQLALTDPLILDYNGIYDPKNTEDRSEFSDFEDNFSDISEAATYRNIVISDDEKLRHELLNSSHQHGEPTFSEYEYKAYKPPPSPTFNLELNKPRNQFPRFQSKSKARILGICCFIVVILLIVIPIAMMKKSDDSKAETIQSSHTSVYDLYWNSYGNSNNIFYNNRTFGYMFFKDPCIIVTDLTLINTIVNSAIPCVGEWCVNGKFTCDLDSNCYAPKYIIGGPCTNITGNLVYTWKRWNLELQGLGILERNIEINTVLSLDVLSYVHALIRNCNLSNRC